MTGKIEYKDSLGRPMPPPVAPLDPPSGTLISSVSPSQNRFTLKNALGCLLILPASGAFMIALISEFGLEKFLTGLVGTILILAIVLMFIFGINLLVNEN